MMPLLKALAHPDNILGTQHRNSPIEIVALGYRNIQARGVPSHAAKMDKPLSRSVMNIGAHRQASGRTSQAE
jgi:hypothetical protein